MAAHIPYGYQIINGKAIINEEEAAKLNILFETCASGSSILSGIQKSGIGKSHGQAGLYLRDQRYLGTEFYPQIIEKEVFEKAEQYRLERCTKLRKGSWKKKREVKKPGMNFRMGKVPKRYKDPYKQAAFAYSRIERMD